MTDAVSPGFKRNSDNDNNNDCGAGSFCKYYPCSEGLKLTVPNVKAWCESQKLSKTVFKGTFLFYS